MDQRAEEKGIELEWPDYIKWDKQFLETCDAFLYLGSSEGADLEREYAEELGLEIYDSVEAVPDATPEQVTDP